MSRVISRNITSHMQNLTKHKTANFTEFRNYTLSSSPRKPKPLSSRVKLLKLRRFHTSAVTIVRSLVRTYVHPSKADLWVFSPTTNDQLAIRLNYLKTSFDRTDIVIPAFAKSYFSFFALFSACVDVILATRFW